MQTVISNYRIFITLFLIIGLTFGPTLPQNILAAEQGTDAAGSTAEEITEGQRGGVDVSGTSGKGSSGQGALAPPPKQDSQPAPAPKPQPKTEPQIEPQIEQEPKPAPVKKAEPKRKPKAIGASAGKAGPATTESGEGLSMGWKIAAGVLGVGLLIGLAGGGGGGGGGDGTTTPAHTNP
jgi:outer membrane biosynthesis protein TonB